MTTTTTGPRTRQRRVRTRTQRKAFADAITYLILTALSIFILLPVGWMLSTALKSNAEVFRFPPRWLPREIHWENFREGLTFLPFMRYLANTTFITVASVFGQLISSPLVAYAFARLRARGRNVLFILILATMMIPSQVTMIPLFILYRILGWVDTYAPLIVPNFFGSAFFIFLLRQFFLTIPTDLGDAARIDGCSHFGVYWRVYLPLSRPAMATVAIFTFMWNWNDFLAPLIYLSTTEKWTLTLALSRFISHYGRTQWNLLMATSLVVVLPCILLFFFAQRYFIQGIVITGVKG
jgi:ABC-type glycerol-3-phosphate transport system permease component